jgi:hypothetical protein
LRSKFSLYVPESAIYPSPIGGELRARRRLLPSNKQSRALSVSRVEKTNMLYIAGYQETWTLLRSSFSKKNQPDRDCEDSMD